MSTLTIDDRDLHKALKVKAAEQSTTIKALVLEYLQIGLNGHLELSPITQVGIKDLAKRRKMTAEELLSNFLNSQK